VRLVLAEDQALLRDGLARLLTAHGHEVVAAVETGPELLDALLSHRPDLAVADIRLPPTFKNEGLAAALEARRALPGLPVLILSQHVEPLYARELLADSTGAIGYLLKDRVSDVRSFVEAIRIVAAGGTTMDPEVIGQMLARRSRDERLSALTPREREVLAAMAEGHANAGIAARLVITEKAVSNHINTIFAKLGLLPDLDGNRRVLAVLAFLDAA
jgi:DNA-binding NarL/FixJ family response regulator